MRRAAIGLVALLIGCRSILGIEDVRPVGADDPDASAQIDAPVIDAGPEAFDCELPLPCPMPESDKLSICGRILDVDSDLPLAIAGPPMSCSGESAGPCSLDMSFYDALEFANNGEGTTPLDLDAVVVDSCGRFRAVNVQSPALGFVAIGVDDPVDVFVLAAVTRASSAGAVLDDTEVFAITAASDQAWTTSAGDPFGGPTFSAAGAALLLFEDNGARVAGVTATVSGNPVMSGNGFYFASDSADRLAAIDNGIGSTSNVGAVLVTNSSLVDHSGTGSERGGCEWDSALADAISGVIFVAPRRLVSSGSQLDCP